MTPFQTLAASLALTGLGLSAQASTSSVQALVPASSEIIFVSKQMGVPVAGHFKKFDAKLNFDPAQLDRSSVAITVDLASATLGVPATDAELPKATWFNTAQFPQARFHSSSIKSLGAGQFNVSGTLSIKGQSRPVQMPVMLSQNGATTVASGVLPLQRLAFRIGENEWADTSMVADEVQVKFKLTLSGVGKL